MPGREQQKNRDLKRAAKSCNKTTDLFKKARTQESQDNLNNIVDEVSQNESFENDAPSKTSTVFFISFYDYKGKGLFLMREKEYFYEENFSGTMD